jgi:tetratricopeptide (TPR) repeat protein
VLSPGSVVQERFEILAHVAEGGMGVVYRALDRHTGAPVALKLLGGVLIDPQAAERFAREARVLAELQHPGIVRYEAHGRTDDGRPFLAMEWIDGGDLESRLRTRPLTLHESLTVIRRAAEALAVAHRRGIVHRDLKPSNLLLRDGDHDRVALVDFGLARHGISPAAVTGTGNPIGTPAYMSPEQARGERDLTPATDVFSLGCVLYECLAGAPPFYSARPGVLLAKLLFDTAPPIRSVRPSVPERIEQLLQLLLARNAAGRPRDATALTEAIDALEPMPDRTPPPAPPRATILVESEQQLACVVIAVPPEGTAPSAVEGASAGDLERAISGLRPTVLSDGTVVVTVTQEHGATATDMAVCAARCALVLDARRPYQRIVVATGRGVVRHGQASGEVHDRAQRLLKGGGAGIVIDELTAALVDTRFLTTRTESGVRLEAERPAPDDSRPLCGRPTSCLGREQELTILSTLIAGSFEEPAASIALVTAGAGLGKSRLRQELLRRLDGRGDKMTVLLGRGDPMTAGVPYGLLAQALRRLFGIAENAELAARRAQLEAGLGRFTADPLTLIFVGELCGIPFPDERLAELRAARENPLIMAERVADAFVALVRAGCRVRPWLLVLEDLHWGDALTVRLVHLATGALADEPFCVLALARPEVADAFPRLWAERTVREIRLGGLPRRAAERLVAESLGDRLSPSAIARLVERAGGNPLFLEELIRAVAEGKADELPETVLATMQARLMRLDAGARQMLRAASVFGERFWRSGVLALVGGDAAGVDAWLEALVASEVLQRRRESRFPAEPEYVFRHALLRDAAYSSLTDADRRAAHREAGSWLETHGEDPYVLAEHLWLGDDAAGALPHYLAAAQQAFENADLATALARCDRALACGASGEALGRVRAVQAGCRVHTRDFRAALEAGGEALRYLPRGSSTWCQSLAWLLVAAGLLADMAKLFELVRQLEGVEPEPAARGAHVQALSVVVTMFAVMGAHERARPHLERMAGLVEGAGESARAWYTLARGIVGRYAGRLWEAYQDICEARRTFERIGDRRQAVMHTLTMFDVERDLNDLTAAEEHARWSLEEAERLGEHQAVLMARVKLAACRVAAGDRETIEALATSPEIGQNGLYATILQIALGEARMGAGDIEGAESAMRRAAAAVAGAPLSLQALTGLARVLLAAGRPSEAVGVAEQVTTLLKSGHLGAHRPRARFVVAQCLRAAGDEARAGAELAGALADLRLMSEDMPPEARSRFLAAPDHLALLAAEAQWAGVHVPPVAQ